MLGESYQIKQIFIKKGLGFNISKDTFLASRKKALHIMYYLGPIPSEISFRENCDFPLKSSSGKIRTTGSPKSFWPCRNYKNYKACL